MSSENQLDLEKLGRALSEAGKDALTRNTIIDLLRDSELRAADKPEFRQNVRWPLLLALLKDNPHEVSLANGLRFQITPSSRIEKSFLLSMCPTPEFFWEPQTTKLLVKLASKSSNAIIGGAYIGDHAIPMSKATSGLIHAFEPMSSAFGQLVTNIELNGATNISANQLCLWDESNCLLAVEGEDALASAHLPNLSQNQFTVASISVDDYIMQQELPGVDLIMLDTEGGEDRALRGALSQLSKDKQHAPDIVFEVHRNFVDWSNGLAQTEPVQTLISLGYEIFAIRDIQGNLELHDYPLEVIPINAVYLEGPPHGFNLFATKKHNLLSELGLEVVENVSPKLIREKDPALHHPLRGWPESDNE